MDVYKMLKYQIVNQLSLPVLRKNPDKALFS